MKFVLFRNGEEFCEIFDLELDGISILEIKSFGSSIPGKIASDKIKFVARKPPAREMAAYQIRAENFAVFTSIELVDGPFEDGGGRYFKVEATAPFRQVIQVQQ